MSMKPYYVCCAEYSPAVPIIYCHVGSKLGFNVRSKRDVSKNSLDLEKQLFYIDISGFNNFFRP